MNREYFKWKMAIMFAAIALHVIIAVYEVSKSEEEMVLLAAGEYNYTAMYYSSADEVMIYHYYALEEELDGNHVTSFEYPPESEKEGTLTVKTNSIKLIVTASDGLSFTTSAIVPDDVMVNPSNCFTFTIPAQQSGESQVD